MRKYCILGTDLRSKYLRKIFIKEKKEITDLEDADVVIAPIPFTKDNIKINGEIISISKYKRYFNYRSNTKRNKKRTNWKRDYILRYNGKW